MEKLIVDGKVAVLYSPGFGAGWSTWNSEYPELMFDPNIVHYLEKGDKQSILSYCELKYPGAYLGGLDGLEVAWIPVGAEFVIDEYDGSETVVNRYDMTWVIA